MTMDEAIRQYQIPKDICSLYKQIKANNESYNEKDIEHLSLMTTLKQLDFTDDQITEYIQLQMSDANTIPLRLQTLESHRQTLLHAYHKIENQLDTIDYLRNTLIRTMEG